MTSLRIRCVLLALAWLGLASPAAAGLTEREIAAIGAAPPAGGRAPLDLVLRDDAGRSVTVEAALGGRPALLLPVDPACRSICGPALAILTDALGRTDLRAGRDYALVLLAIGGRTETVARDAIAAQLGDASREGVTVLTGPEDGVRRLADAVGYRYADDPGNDAVAHPSALLSLASDGRVSRVLSSLALNPDDLRLALVEAGEGQVGDLGDRVRLLCYGFDAVHGIYTARIETALRVGAALTVAALAGGIGWLVRRSARPDPAA